MIRDRVEKLGSIFLVVFATLLALLFAADGMGRTQQIGALLAVSASMALAFAVRVWPHPSAAEIERD